jgi:hypothetical protein
MAANTIRGRTLTGSQTQSGVRVLALDAALDECLASAESDAAGSYALDVPDTLDNVVLLARFRGPAFGAVHRRMANRPAEHTDLALDDVFPLELELVGDVPDTALVTLLPDVIAGWTEPAAETWTYRLDHNRNESFSAWTMTGHAAHLALQSGTWRLSVWHREGRAREATSSPREWYVSRAELVDGAELDVAATGIVLHVSGPLHVRLHMSVTTHQ